MGESPWLGKEKPTRKQSGKQESRLAKQFGGKPTANSGAKFHQNDVVTPEYEIEAKTTSSKQFILKVETIEEMNRKCRFGKTPLLIIEFQGSGLEMVVLSNNDFQQLISKK